MYIMCLDGVCYQIFYGGAAYDIMEHDGIALMVVYMSIWQVVTAINMVTEISISYLVKQNDPKNCKQVSGIELGWY